jgi:hypothetical protein
LGIRGEGLTTIDLSELAEALREYPELYRQLDELRTPPATSASAIKIQEFLPSLPPGVGKAYLMPDPTTYDEAIEIDMRTFLAMTRKKNRLDNEHWDGNP